MRIQHNIAALNTHRALGANQAAASKNLEKLSSGYQINRAGDDAAGLAISEKMRGQIRGLDMASKNSQDGISLIQTAEGALNETHSILQRMRELAVQAGNDTNTSDDRSQLQKEMDQLTSEINRIGNTTEFNTKKLVNGELSDSYSTEKATYTDVTLAKNQDVSVGEVAATWTNTAGATTSQADVTVKVSGNTDSGVSWSAAASSTAAGHAADVAIERTSTGFKLTANATTSTGANATTISATDMAYDAATDTYSFNGQGIDVSFKGSEVSKWDKGEKVTLDLSKASDLSAISTNPKEQALTTTGSATITNFKVTDSKLENLGKVDFVYDSTTNKATVTFKDNTTAANTLQSYELSNISAGETLNFSQDGVSFDFSVGTPAANASGSFTLQTENKKVQTKPASTKDQSIKFQIGANEHQSLSVSIGDMRAEALGIVGSGNGFTSTKNVTDGTNATAVESGLDISNHDNAGNAVTVLDKAINSVSSERAKLGAVQNRLEHTINNLGTTSENLTAAESRIRDTDMAKEMMAFTKNNILTQAAQSMLAQANQQPQGVLQLLQ